MLWACNSIVEYTLDKRKVDGANPFKPSLSNCSFRLKGRTSPFHGGNIGSIPIKSKKFNIFVWVHSSMVEHWPFKPLVLGSSPNALKNKKMTEISTTLQQNLLTIFVINAILASFFIILSKNPIHSLISTIIVFINTIFILLISNIEFLALIFLIIYIGAIAILFLFVIMMFNLKKLKEMSLPDEF
jgi:hypothetical protein